MTLLILAIDALDAELVERFGGDEFVLNTSGDFETYAGMLELPYTLEVWTTVATGLHADEHGVTREGTSHWDNPILETLTRATGLLPERTRAKLGMFAEEYLNADHGLGQTDAETVFDPDGRVVHNWPGVTDGQELQRIWTLLKGTNDGEFTDAEFRREALGVAAEQFGWAQEMLRHDVSVAGVHIHTLDAMGHAYATDEDALRWAYERVGGFVEETRDTLGADDELLILSDHGMSTSMTDPDQRPGTHSWRAYVSSTTRDVPESVFDVYQWINENSDEAPNDGGASVDLPEDHLRELGYLE